MSRPVTPGVTRHVTVTSLPMRGPGYTTQGKVDMITECKGLDNYQAGGLFIFGK